MTQQISHYRTSKQRQSLTNPRVLKDRSNCSQDDAHGVPQKPFKRSPIILHKTLVSRETRNNVTPNKTREDIATAIDVNKCQNIHIQSKDNVGKNIGGKSSKSECSKKRSSLSKWSTVLNGGVKEKVQTYTTRVKGGTGDQSLYRTGNFSNVGDSKRFRLELIDRNRTVCRSANKATDKVEKCTVVPKTLKSRENALNCNLTDNSKHQTQSEIKRTPLCLASGARDRNSKAGDQSKCAIPSANAHLAHIDHASSIDKDKLSVLSDVGKFNNMDIDSRQSSPPIYTGLLRSGETKADNEPNKNKKDAKNIVKNKQACKRFPSNPTSDAVNKNSSPIDLSVKLKAPHGTTKNTQKQKISTRRNDSLGMQKDSKLVKNVKVLSVNDSKPKYNLTQKSCTTDRVIKSEQLLIKSQRNTSTEISANARRISHQNNNGDDIQIRNDIRMSSDYSESDPIGVTDNNGNLDSFSSTSTDACTDTYKTGAESCDHEDVHTMVNTQNDNIHDKTIILNSNLVANEYECSNNGYIRVCEAFQPIQDENLKPDTANGNNLSKDSKLKCITGTQSKTKSPGGEDKLVSPSTTHKMHGELDSSRASANLNKLSVTYPEIENGNIEMSKSHGIPRSATLPDRIQSNMVSRLSETRIRERSPSLISWRTFSFPDSSSDESTRDESPKEDFSLTNSTKSGKFDHESYENMEFVSEVMTNGPTNNGQKGNIFFDRKRIIKFPSSVSYHEGVSNANQQNNIGHDVVQKKEVRQIPVFRAKRNTTRDNNTKTEHNCDKSDMLELLDNKSINKKNTGDRKNINKLHKSIFRVNADDIGKISNDFEKKEIISSLQNKKLSKDGLVKPKTLIGQVKTGNIYRSSSPSKGIIKSSRFGIVKSKSCLRVMNEFTDHTTVNTQEALIKDIKGTHECTGLSPVTSSCLTNYDIHKDEGYDITFNTTTNGVLHECDNDKHILHDLPGLPDLTVRLPDEVTLTLSSTKEDVYLGDLSGHSNGHMERDPCHVIPSENTVRCKPSGVTSSQGSDSKTLLLSLTDQRTIQGERTLSVTNEYDHIPTTNRGEYQCAAKYLLSKDVKGISISNTDVSGCYQDFCARDSNDIIQEQTCCNVDQSDIISTLLDNEHFEQASLERLDSMNVGNLSEIGFTPGIKENGTKESKDNYHAPVQQGRIIGTRVIDELGNQDRERTDGEVIHYNDVTSLVAFGGSNCMKNKQMDVSSANDQIPISETDDAQFNFHAKIRHECISNDLTCVVKCNDDISLNKTYEGNFDCLNNVSCGSHNIKNSLEIEQKCAYKISKIGTDLDLDADKIRIVTKKEINQVINPTLTESEITKACQGYKTVSSRGLYVLPESEDGVTGCHSLLSDDKSEDIDVNVKVDDNKDKTSKADAENSFGLGPITIKTDDFHPTGMLYVIFSYRI